MQALRPPWLSLVASMALVALLSGCTPTARLGQASEQTNLAPGSAPPQLTNLEQVGELIQGYYPAELRDAGVGGRVELWLFVNTQGLVERSPIKTSSGHPQLDEAAQRVAGEMRFVPATLHGENTDAWVSQWLTFEVVECLVGNLLCRKP